MTEEVCKRKCRLFYSLPSLYQRESRALSGLVARCLTLFDDDTA